MKATIETDRLKQFLKPLQHFNDEINLSFEKDKVTTKVSDLSKTIYCDSELLSEVFTKYDAKDEKIRISGTKFSNVLARCEKEVEIERKGAILNIKSGKKSFKLDLYALEDEKELDITKFAENIEVFMDCRLLNSTINDAQIFDDLLIFENDAKGFRLRTKKDTYVYDFSQKIKEKFRVAFNAKLLNPIVNSISQESNFYFNTNSPLLILARYSGYKADFLLAPVILDEDEF